MSHVISVTFFVFLYYLFIYIYYYIYIYSLQFTVPSGTLYMYELGVFVILPVFSLSNLDN